MKVALVQLNAAWEDKRENLARAEKLLAEASGLGCDLALLPEMFSTGFSMNVDGIAEPEDGPTARFLSDAAKKFSLNIIAGFAASGKGPKGRNVAHAYGVDGRLLASYAKIHPFCFAGEDEHYEAGEGPVVFDIVGVPSSVFICYDLRFPESMREVASRAKVIFVIANWPAERISHWSALLKARAIENQCFVVGVNRTGTDANGLEYPGASGVFDPEGKEICVGPDSQELIVCSFEPSQTDRIRADFPFLKDMNDNVLT